MPDMLTGEETLAVASCPHPDCLESWSIAIEDAEAAGDDTPVLQPVDEVRRHLGPMQVELR